MTCGCTRRIVLRCPEMCSGCYSMCFSPPLHFKSTTAEEDLFPILHHGPPSSLVRTLGRNSCKGAYIVTSTSIWKRPPRRQGSNSAMGNTFSQMTIETDRTSLLVGELNSITSHLHYLSKRPVDLMDFPGYTFRNLGL